MVVVRVGSFFCSTNFCYFFVLSLHFVFVLFRLSLPEKAIILLLVCVMPNARTQYMCLVEFNASKVNVSCDLPTRPWFLSLGSIFPSWYGSRCPYGE